ncbi:MULTISPECIES: hypothetical protein [unclassified Pseudomonas]|uniref:hypothetical protein n=1 Tax=unclassified Pseudomonas TaxID=196821 RepID=UPI0011BE56F3|nr:MULTISPECIES: hypothetical protein [unclassified Pseudomonas]
MISIHNRDSELSRYIGTLPTVCRDPTLQALLNACLDALLIVFICDHLLLAHFQLRNDYRYRGRQRQYESLYMKKYRLPEMALRQPYALFIKRDQNRMSLVVSGDNRVGAWHFSRGRYRHLAERSVSSLSRIRAKPRSESSRYLSARWVKPWFQKTGGVSNFREKGVMQIYYPQPIDFYRI